MRGLWWEDICVGIYHKLLQIPFILVSTLPEIGSLLEHKV